jgi:hypothetical protein
VSGEPDWTGHLIYQAEKEIRHEKRFAHRLSRKRKRSAEKKQKHSTGAVLGGARHGHRGTGGLQYVRGGITKTVIPSPNDPFGRVLGNVNGVLNGARTAVITSRNPANATSSDVFVTKGGDMLTATGAVTLTAVPGKPPGEFTSNATLTGHRGIGQVRRSYRFEGQGHNVFGGPGVGTFDVIYQGSVCGPNLKAETHEKAEDRN